MRDLVEISIGINEVEGPVEYAAAFCSLHLFTPPPIFLRHLPSFCPPGWRHGLKNVLELDKCSPKFARKHRFLVLINRDRSQSLFYFVRTSGKDFHRKARSTRLMYILQCTYLL